MWLIALVLVVFGGWYYGFGPGKGTFNAKQKPAPVAPAPTTSGEAYKIGVILPLSGDSASLGTALSHAVTLAVAELNARNGIAGRPVRAIFEDGKCTNDGAVAAAKKLIENDGVKYIVGGGCSNETLGAAPLVEKNKVVLISPSATAPEITAAGAYVFRLAVSDAQIKKGFAPYFNPGSERAASFFAAYREKYGEPTFPFYQANAYSIVFLIKDLIEQNAMDTEKAIKSLQTLKDWAGGAHGSLTLDKNGDVVWKDFVEVK